MSSRTQVAKLASENGLGNVFWDGSSIRMLRRSQYSNAVAKDCEIVEVAEVPLGLKRCTSLHCLHYGILNPKPPQAEQASTLVQHAVAFLALPDCSALGV